MAWRTRAAPTAEDLEEVFHERLHASWTRSTAPYSNTNYGAAMVHEQQNPPEDHQRGCFWTGIHICDGPRGSGGGGAGGCDMRDRVIVDRTPENSVYNSAGIDEHDLDGDGVLSRDELKAQRAKRLGLKPGEPGAMPVVEGTEESHSMPYKVQP